MPFILLEETNTYKLYPGKIVPASEKKQNDRRYDTVIIMPFSKEHGNTMCGFGSWRNAIGRSLTVFAQHIIITYIHQQDGLK